MNDRTAAPARGAQRAKIARRGGPSGRLVVGEYVGQAAGDAAQAVRRAGLRPGLDRSFGCEAELIGLIVAQEPAAGGDLARNGMVTLYVAAPGNAPVDEDTDAPETLGGAPVSAPAVPVQADVAQFEAPSALAGARRRKPGLAGRAAQVFDPSPAPVAPDRGGAGEAPAALVARATPVRAWVSQAPVDAAAPRDDEEHFEGVLDERGEEELSHEEFVVHADDVFAGRAGGLPRWRRVYPRRRTAGAPGGVRAWLAEHPRLVRAVGAGLAVWAVVGLAAALDGHRERIPTGSVISPGEGRAGTRTTGARGRASAPSAGTVRPAVGLPRAHPRPQHGGAPRRRLGPASAGEAAARREGAGVRAPPAPRATLPAPPTSASGPPRPAAEQTPGGLFSP